MYKKYIMSLITLAAFADIKDTIVNEFPNSLIGGKNFIQNRNHLEGLLNIAESNPLSMLYLGPAVGHAMYGILGENDKYDALIKDMEIEYAQYFVGDSGAKRQAVFNQNVKIHKDLDSVFAGYKKAGKMGANTRRIIVSAFVESYEAIVKSYEKNPVPEAVTDILKFLEAARTGLNINTNTFMVKEDKKQKDSKKQVTETDKQYKFSLFGMGCCEVDEKDIKKTGLDPEKEKEIAGGKKMVKESELL